MLLPCPCVCQCVVCCLCTSIAVLQQLVGEISACTTPPLLRIQLYSVPCYITIQRATIQPYYPISIAYNSYIAQGIGQLSEQMFYRNNPLYLLYSVMTISPVEIWLFSVSYPVYDTDIICYTLRQSIQCNISTLNSRERVLKQNKSSNRTSNQNIYSYQTIRTIGLETGQ